MKLSQLAAEASACLADLRARHGSDADAEVFVSFTIKGIEDQREATSVELFLDPGNGKDYFEIKTEKEEE